jgi:tRNA nucleotidyltransferase (CCA-adding enzyme)
MISVEPTKDEKSRLKEVVNSAISEIKKETEKIDGRINPMLLGSASRDTWLREEKDLDIFLVFPLEYEKKGMEEIVTNIGKKILKDVTKRYAEHPYVRGKYRGFDIEIVPCFGVDSPEKLKSAVDRTPFHDAFVRENIKGKETEVRLLKQFLKGIGCYGAEARVEGFSGYLCELMVIKYGSFEEVLESAREWRYGKVIWIDGATNKENIKKFPEPLVFIDPVDKNRNVASALSLTKLSEFIFASQRFLEEPKDEFFFPKIRTASRKDIIKIFENRKTSAIAIVFDTPDLIDDILYPQLRRAAGAIKKQLLRSDFKIFGIDFFIKEKTCIFIEFESIEIPKMRLHLGPKVNTAHESRFLSKYQNFEGKLSEPFITGDRWAIFLERKYESASAFLDDFLSQPDLEKNGIPKYIAHSITLGYEIKEGKDAIMDNFLDGLLDFFDPKFPWET